jgi:two-component system phosphate regulon sensor histidine kinase PhoR
VAKNFQRLGYRRIVQLLVYLVIIPTVLLLFMGIVLMVLHEGMLNLVLGILTVAFVALVATGVILVLVFVRREANLSELQADFVSKVSHELRTPLTAIRLFAETMDRSRGDAVTQQKCLAMLMTETERLTRRIERLLDWGRMEAGRKLYDLQPESVTAIVEGAAETFPPARYGEIDFEMTVEAALPSVKVDRAAVVDAIVNLLSNAQKYGGSPPVVRLSAKLSEDGDVAISVSDNGAGIAPREHRRIFEKFYRIDDRLARDREGSGLGLAIVRHIVRGHGGRVMVESAEGRGSTFTLVLPAVHGAAAEAAKSAPKSDGVPADGVMR